VSSIPDERKLQVAAVLGVTVEDLMGWGEAE
jgi:hypothetical protein